MTLIEAIKTKKRIRRNSWPALRSYQYSEKTDKYYYGSRVALFNEDEVMAIDWVPDTEPSTETQGRPLGREE